MIKNGIIVAAFSLIVLIALTFLPFTTAQEHQYLVHRTNNPKIGNDAPKMLNIDQLLATKKYRVIHHDSFCREENRTEIGNNALPGRAEVMAYKTLSKGHIDVGICVKGKTKEMVEEYFKYSSQARKLDILSKNDVRLYNHYASNFTKSSKNARCIKYIEPSIGSYRIIGVRGNQADCDTKIAFNVNDIDNFCYASLTENRIVVGQYQNGKHKILYSKAQGGLRLEVELTDKKVSISIDETQISVLKFRNNLDTCCGLFFDNKTVSLVDDFIVDYEDVYQNARIDEAIENKNIENGQFGYYCSESNAYSISDKVVSKGKYSYRFSLIKPSADAVALNRDKALHSTIMLNGVTEKGGNSYYAGSKGGNKPLDSFILSIDVLFPDSDEEEWKLDELFNELFIQEHHVGYGIPFSPSISININRGRMLLNTIWLEPIAKGKRAADNPTTDRAQFFARINSDEEEEYLKSKNYGDYKYLPVLKKGEWHNFTLYVKLGYNYNQKPRTILYVDKLLVIDWHTPNAYNCQEYGEYMEFGVYKWSWDTQKNRDMTPIEKRVIYFDNIQYFI